MRIFISFHVWYCQYWWICPVLIKGQSYPLFALMDENIVIRQLLNVKLLCNSVNVEVDWITFPLIISHPEWNQKCHWVPKWPVAATEENSDLGTIPCVWQWYIFSEIRSVPCPLQCMYICDLVMLGVSSFFLKVCIA